MYQINALRWLAHLGGVVILGWLGISGSNSLDFFDIELSLEVRAVLVVFVVAVVIVSGLGNVLEGYKYGKIHGDANREKTERK